MEAVARERLLGILQEAERLGVAKEAVVRLAAARRPPPPPAQRSSLPFWLVAVSLALVVYKAELYSRVGIARAISYWSPSHDKCTVWMPDIVTRALRPPVDCSMCRDVHSIDRVSNITPKEFEEISCAALVDSAWLDCFGRLGLLDKSGSLAEGVDDWLNWLLSSGDIDWKEPLGEGSEVASVWID
ncbi:hypothetical protein GE061_006285 [Apolygus lucorum]|uniref:Uncharacterized protein n=1 Tax=Apolygus lucorum TaxID=248454 RepID=A0A8S9WTJ0_APOLU|nr:hypothetical protein GE061_006285 [Apolygus lucorum]